MIARKSGDGNRVMIRINVMGEIKLSDVCLSVELETDEARYQPCLDSWQRQPHGGATLELYHDAASPLNPVTT